MTKYPKLQLVSFPSLDPTSEPPPIATMFAARRLATQLPRTRAFHASAPAFVKKGDAIPNLDLVENSPGNKVNLAKEIKGKGVIIGTPAAFSTWLPTKASHQTISEETQLTISLGPACSSTHVPGYINHPKLREAGQVFVISVNDPFVYVLRWPTNKTMLILF